MGTGPVQGKEAPRPDHPEKFNTYRFSDHKEGVIDLLQRVCTVSVATMEIVDSMAQHEAPGPVVDTRSAHPYLLGGMELPGPTRCGQRISPTSRWPGAP